ncbi:MAG: hypothetical protein IJ473_00605 [Alphaproteobacteria bacterium]|nr:hypothetical protein [Alphaproteobacteria bacterium]
MRLRNLSIISLVFIPTPALATTYVCEACPAGTWGDGTNCNKCSAGTYAYTGSSSCTSCLTTGVVSCSATTGRATSCKGGFSFLSSGACSQCSAGTYSIGGTTGSCSTCPAGKYSGAGASSCSSCSSTSYGKWSGNCGTVKRNVTKYCTKAGSTSSTGNAETTTESTTMSCSGHTYCSATTNGTCTACSNPPSNSGWDSSSGCGWHCNDGYYKSGNNCKLRIYAFFKTVNNCAGDDKSGYFSVTEYDYKKEMVDGVSYTYNGKTSRDRVIFSSTNPGSHTVSKACTAAETKEGKSYDNASTRLTPVNEGSYLNLSEKCTDGSGWINECSFNNWTYTWTRK